MSIRVSQSRVKTWRRCARAHYNKYVLGYTKKKVKRPLSFGKMVHEMIEAHANGKDPFDVLESIPLDKLRLFAQEREHYGEIIEDLGIIMEAYFDYWESQPTKLRYVGIGGKRAEHKFEIEIMTDVIWVGLIDAIGRERRSRWLVEHKTFSRMPTEEDRWRSLQSAVYVRANDIMGWRPLDGTLWDYIWSKAPPRPAPLKDGSLSKRNTPTLKGAIKLAAKEHGRPRSEVKALATLTHRPELWFSRTRNPLKSNVVDILFADFERSVKEIVDNGDNCRVMNIERHCSWCDFEPLCRAELTNGDVDFILAREFTIDKKDHSQAGREEGDEGASA